MRSGSPTPPWRGRIVREEIYRAILTLRRRGFKVERGNSDSLYWLTIRDGRHLLTDEMLLRAASELNSQLPLPLDIPLQF